jgi:hypothetical protein
MSYRVLVPCVIARDTVGHSHHHYDGAIINWLPDDQARRFLDEGLVAEVDGTPDDRAPAKTAPKADWVTFAVSKGADADEAEALTKQELVELYGG